MHKVNRKSFNWYGMRQHFSIRKYHFGAASVLLGMSLALGAGVQVAQAETNAAASETATVASTTATSTISEATVAETVATATETATTSTAASSTEASTTETVATATSTERTATINYIVQYVLEDGTVVQADVKTTIVNTTEATAKTNLDVAIEVPAGYELATGQTAAVTQEVTEGAANVVTVKVAKTAEVTTITATMESATTTTATSETATETKATTTATASSEVVAEAEKTPATVEEAKVVLEQVISEAEVLANEAERLVAASDSDNTALKSAAAATKLTATEATAVLNASAATLDSVNAQIDAIRINVEVLVFELRKFLATDSIQIALNTTGTASASNLVTGTFKKGNEVLITSQSSNDEMKVSVQGTDAKYDNMRIEYIIEEDGVQIQLPASGSLIKLSGFNNAVPVYNATSNSYTLQVGNLISGSDITIPLSFVAPNGTVNGKSIKVIAKVLDSSGLVYGTGEKTVTWNAIETATITSTIAQNTFGFADDGSAIAGIRDQNGVVQARSARSYVLTLDETTKSAIKAITDVSGVNISTAGSLPKDSVVRVYYDKDNFKPVTSGNVSLTRGTNQSGRIINEAEGYIEYPIGPSGTLHEIEQEVKGFYLVYTGNAETIPDTVLTTRVIERGTNQVLAETTSSHTNSWVTREVPTGVIGVNTRIDTGYTLNYATGTTTGISMADNAAGRNDNSSTTSFGTSYKGESMGTEVTKPLATGQTTQFRRGTRDTGIVNTVDRVSVDVAKQQDGDMLDYFTKTNVVIGNVDVLTLMDNRDAIVYYINNSGVRINLGSLGDFANETGVTSNRKSVSISDTVATVGIDFTGTSGAFYQSLDIEMIQLSESIDYKVTDVATGHKLTDRTIVTPELNDYSYTAQLIQRQSPTDEAVTWKSAFAGYAQEQVTINTRIRQRGADSKNLYDGDKANFTGSLETSRTAGLVNNIPLNENAYVYVAMAEGLSIDSIVPGTQLSTDQSTYQKSIIQVDGQNYVVYKIPFKEGVTSVIPGQASVTVNYTMNSTYFYGSQSDSKTTNIYYGLSFDSIPSFVHTGGTDALDLDNDGDGAETVYTKDATTIIGTQGQITGKSPKSLFVYDKSNYQEGYLFDTTGVIAGDPVTIQAHIQNRSDVAYSDMTVITVLSNTEDEVFDGSSSRGSQFTPTLNGPVTAPAGWKVYYTTDQQDPGEAGNDLTGWIDTITDYSTVTALKFVSDPGTTLSIGQTIAFEYGLDTPSNAKSGQQFTTTSAIAINGQSNFLEGYRSTVEILRTYGSVVVKYVDIDGNSLQDDVIDMPTTSLTGTEYDTSEHASATIVSGGKTYELVPSGTYPVGTVDDNSNLTAHADTTNTSGIEPTTGEVGIGEKVVTYVYKEVTGSVVVKYVDEVGNPISGTTDKGVVTPSTVIDTPESSVGTAYDTATDNKPIEITVTTDSGETRLYRFKEVQADSASETGVVEKGEKVVTYVYELVKGNVKVNYQTLDGEEIIPSVNDEIDAPVGQAYDTKDQIKETITTADGRVYRRVPRAIEGAETGKVVEGTTEVTYFYELLKGDVLVNYENTEGKVIAPQVVDTNDANTGSEYSTTDYKPKKIIENETGDVYYILPTDEVKAGSASETGKVTPETQEVTYIYQKAGNVVVNYTLADGTVLKDPVNDETNQEPGYDYNTTDNKPETIATTDGKVYKLVPTATIGNETGDVESGKTIEVTYIYEEVKSDVVVEYYNTAGEVIAATVVDEDDKSVGTVYNTDEDNRPETITTADGTVYYYKEVKDTSAPTTGTVAETTTTVQYVYEKAGSVNVNYVDVNGTEIKADVLDVENGQPGSNYDTLADNRPDTIVATDGKTYKLVPEGDYPAGTVAADSNLASGDAPTGAVEAGLTKEVTYVYQEVKGNVIVNYVDENGNPISGITDAGTETASTVEDTPESSTGTEYNTTDLRPNTITTADGKIYKLVPSAIPANETGKVVEGTSEVTYVYELLQGDVIVHYVDTEGNTIADDVTDTQITDTGTDYDTTDNKPNKIVNDETGDVYYILPTDEVKAGDKETGKVVEGTTEVTYIYQKAGNVVVNYTLADGTVIKDPVNDETNQEPGYDYNTADNKLETITTTDGKVYKLVPTATIGNETGDVEAGKTIEVTYIYEEVKSDVVVEYYDTEGNSISGTETDNATSVVDTEDASVGTAYNTDDKKPATITAADGTVYYYKEVKDTSAPTTGNVAETTTTVQYVYEKAGDVIVHYITTDGTPISGVTNTGSVIASTVDDTVNGKPGSTYDTSDLRPTTITTDEGKTYELVPTATIGNETGDVEAGKTTEVTYVYKEVKGSVVVNYVTTDGTVLQAPVTDTPETSTGTPYDTTDVMPGTITTEDGKTYKLVPSLTKGSETGDVVPGVTQVTYVYEEVKGDVVVNYVNTAGEVIAPQVVDTKTTSTGTDYDTKDNKPAKITTEDGTVYYYKEVDETSAAENGKVVEGTTEITYVYEQAGSVTVNYVTTDGTVIKSPVKDEENAEPGKTYSTEDNKPETITTEDGKTYKLVPNATTGEENGTITSGEDKQVTYVYEEVKGNVVVEYYNTAGEKIAEDVEDTPASSTGTAYTTLDNKPETITATDGTVYYYKEVKADSAAETGDVVEGTTTVQYVYEQAGNVVVNYITEDGTVIKSPVKDEENAEPGKTYSTEDNKPTTITTEDGKTYELIPAATIGNETGDVEAGKTTEVTYVYKEVKGSVVVNYVSTDGTVIQDPVTDTPETSTGTDYSTTDNKPETITTKDGKTYRLVPKLTQGSETGDVVPGVTQVTYVYEEVKGDVVVNYVNTAGEVIAPQVVDTKTTSTGTAYDTTDNKPAKITTEDGTVYYYKEVDATSATETGKVVEGTTEVTYVYEPAGSVTVNYVTTDGTVIKSPVKDEENAEPGKTYTTEDNKPTTITTEDGKTYKLVPSLTTGEENGSVTPGEDKQVTYVYEEVKGNVVVEYYNTAGEKIATDVEDTPASSTGTAYTTLDNKPETITATDGTVYYYKEVKADSAAETGDVVEGTTTVKYVYEQAGNVVVNYITEDGTVIKDPVNDETNAAPGSEYNTTDNKPTTITTENGKTYELIPAATIGTEEGTVEAGKTTEVTYVYKEVKGSVVVNYVTTDGTVLQAPVTDTPETSTGTPYDTTDVKPGTITTADGKTYKLVPTLTKGSETGDVVPGVTEVTYVYEEVKGDVVVNYVNTDGKVIASQVVDTPSTSTSTDYNTTDNKPAKITTEDGTVYYYKEVDATSAAENGKVVEGTTEITYVYEQAGSVTVNYVTTDGTVIKSPVKDEENAEPGKTYTTEDNKPGTITTEDGKTYKLVPNATTGEENGTITSGEDKQVTYVYEEVKGDVVVEYYNTAGEKIAKDVEDTPASSTGTAYTTLDNKPAKITAADGTVYYYKEVKADSAAETGDVVEGTTTVKYVYEKAGNVVVNYITEDGTVIKTPVKDEENAEPGKSYDTTDNKPTTITTEDGTTYELVPSATIGTENGEVESGKTTEVTYVYRKVETPAAKTGNVVVEYYNTAGEKIATDVVDTPETTTGTVYETFDFKPATITKDGVTYFYKEVKDTSAAEKGTVVEGTTTVQYVYEPAGSVTVNYVTTDGTVIKSPVKDEENAEPGKTYSTEDNKPTTITTEDGKTYKLVPSLTTGEENGSVTPGEDKQVTYVYEEVKGDVVVNYIDTEGNVIKAPVTDTASTSTGTAYDTTDNKPETITTEDGTEYKLVPVLTKGNENGSVVEGTTQVTYVYQKVTTPAPNPNGSVVVNYVNTNGETIATSVNDTTDAALDTTYDTTDFKPAVIKHNGVTHFYKEVKAGDNESGKVVEGTTEVTYVYEPAGSVTVNYVTTDGTVIKSPVKDEENAEPGKTYTTEDNKPTTITTEDGKTYKLVPSLTTGEENGSVTPGEDKQVTYVYEEVKGDVVVNYIDTEGNVIKASVTDTPSTSTGTSYDTTDNKPTTITTADGSVYELVPVLTQGNENGSVVEGTTQVTYVYRKVSSAVKSPVTNHVDENGKSISPQEDGTKPNTSIPGYEFTGKTTVDEDGNVTHVYRKVTPKGTVVVNYITED
ncbi:TPA: MucBP domain-containing protein, partial [Streptococcus suis]|nr:MucBP domain-containing protein [Streptococcus suis]